MSEATATTGAAPRVPLLDRIIDHLKSGRHRRTAELLQGAGYLRRVLADREQAGLQPHSSILFVFPENTEAVSSTGHSCSLDCAHCRGHYLESMTPMEELPARIKSGVTARSWLISGGCDATGRIPPLPEPLMRALSRIGRLNLHVGSADDVEIEMAARYADCISLDMIGCDETIRRVMGLDRTARDYLSTYQLLRERLHPDVSIIPHVVVGLDGGRLRGEYELIDALAEDQPEAMVLLVLRPTPGTPMAEASPPDLDDVFECMMHARASLVDTQLHLGCMRPSGGYRQALDLLAAACDFDVLVQPTPAVRRIMLRPDSEVQVSWGDECCALYPALKLHRRRGPFSDLTAFRTAVHGG